MTTFDNEHGTACKNLTVEESLEYTYTDVDFMLILVCIPVICVLGIFLNLAYLFVLCRIRDMCTTTNVYLGNLAVADSLLLLVRLIRYVGTYFYSPVDIYGITPFNNVVTCGLPILLINFFHFVSIFFISLVALERYDSICRPLTHRRISSKLQTMRYIILAWILPFVFVTCHAGSFDLQKDCVTFPSSSSQIHFKVCPKKLWVSISIALLSQCQFWAALIFNCTMYMAIVRKLNSRNRESALTKTTEERNYVAKMLIANATVFFICIMPMRIYDVLYFLDVLGDIDLLFLLPTSLWIAIVTSTMNSAVNPLIYGAANPNYMKAFRKAFLIPYFTARKNTHAAIKMRRKDVEA